MNETVSLLAEMRHHDGNIWEKKLKSSAFQKSRPKSLEMTTHHDVLHRHWSLYGYPGHFQAPNFSVLCLKNDNFLFRLPENLQKSMGCVNGFTARPFTWGPNGSKFTDVIALISDSSRSLIKPTNVLDDLTNNNIPIKTSTALPPCEIMCRRNENCNNVDKHEDKANPVQDVLKMIQPSASLSKESSGCLEEDGERLQPILKTTSIATYEKEAEAILTSIVNSIVIGEASRKSEEIFRENEKRIEREIHLKKERCHIQKLLLDLVECVVQTEKIPKLALKKSVNGEITKGTEENVCVKSLCQTPDATQKTSEVAKVGFESLTDIEPFDASVLEGTKGSNFEKPWRSFSDFDSPSNAEEHAVTIFDELVIEDNFKNKNDADKSSSNDVDDTSESAADGLDETLFFQRSSGCDFNADVQMCVEELLENVVTRSLDWQHENTNFNFSPCIANDVHATNESNQVRSPSEPSLQLPLNCDDDWISYFDECDLSETFSFKSSSSNSSSSLSEKRDDLDFHLDDDEQRPSVDGFDVDEESNDADVEDTGEDVNGSNKHEVDSVSCSFTSADNNDIKADQISNIENKQVAHFNKLQDTAPQTITLFSTQHVDFEMSSEFQSSDASVNNLNNKTLPINDRPEVAKILRAQSSQMKNVSTLFESKHMEQIKEESDNESETNQCYKEQKNDELLRNSLVEQRCFQRDSESTARRPTSLFCQRTSGTMENFKVFSYLKDLSPSNLTPVRDFDKNADVYSEATEKVLEENKSFGRQESFTRPIRPLKYRSKRTPYFTEVYHHAQMEEEEEEEKEEYSDEERDESGIDIGNDLSSDTELFPRSSTFEAPGPTCLCQDTSMSGALQQSRRSRSLPFNFRDYSDIIKFEPLDLSFDENLKPEVKTTPTAFMNQFSCFLDVDEDRNRRDSALSRESAASSGTVVATDDDDFEQTLEYKDTLGHLNKTSKYSPSTQSPLVMMDTNDRSKITRKIKMERSQSLDRQQRTSRRLPKYSVPVIHQPHCEMMLGTPNITVTSDCNGVHRSMTSFDPVLSSSQSLASSSSYMGDESDALRSSSIGSSPVSSPTASPKLLRKSHKSKQKSKTLTLRSTKHAERQAAEACEWLKAAGFPQYVQLYENGHFPVDIASASSDHDFLGQEHIAALVRRLNILNKCASMKLDKTMSRETPTDNEDDELDHYALSEFWKFEEDGHRWSRLDSKASSIGSPTTRFSLGGRKQSSDGVLEDSNSEVFGSEDRHSINDDSSISEDKLSQNRLSIDQPRLVPNKPAHLKPKSHSFLKRMGGDLKKFGSFKRKDSQRPTTVDIPLDDDTPRHAPKARHKSFRKNRNLSRAEISRPVPLLGHERFDQMKCIPIDNAPSAIKELQNQHRRKLSSNSLMSSSSSSGAASTVSTPASRRTRASTEDFSSDLGEMSPGFHHRRGVIELTHGSNNVGRIKEHSQDKENSLFMIPHGYKPGTFPAALRERTDNESAVVHSPVSVPTRSHSISDAMPSVANTDSLSRTRPMSIYDNLPDTAISGNVSTQDIMKILDPGSPLRGVNDSDAYLGSMDSLDVLGSGVDPAFWSVDDIVEHTQNLQQMVGLWDVGDDESVDNMTDTTPAVDPPFPSAETLPSYTAETASNIDEDSDTTSLMSGDLRSQLLLRWEPIKRENSTESPSADSVQLHTLSASQLMMLKRLSMLKLTARMEKYALNNSKGTLSWFIRRMKVPDYKDKTVFGVPLLQNVQRFGQPLPICIQHALAYLRRSALDQVGLFRKPGVRGRIHKLRALCELNPEMEIFEECTDYDIADLIKQYFRELPDPLMTMKMSETFVGIFLYVPENMQLQTLQAAIMLLPDENRETLSTLLYFLADVASNFDENQMNASNLATCFAPSLFYQQIGNIRLVSSSASPKNKKSHGGKSMAGKPDMRAMNENIASNQCLAFMIKNVQELFNISEDATTQCRLSVMQQNEDVLASEIGFKLDPSNDKEYYADFHCYVDREIRQTMKEEQRLGQGRTWQNVATLSGSELAFKKMTDGNPLRMWRSQVEVCGADPLQIMDRILNERHLWDSDLVQWKILQQPDERTQIFQVVRAEMSPHPSRDYCVLRSWRTDVNSKGAAVILEVSTGQQPLLGDVRGVILVSRYIIEPTEVSNKCLLTHICRVDTKGRNPEWYNKAYGHLVTQNLLKIRDSIKNVPPKISSLIT